MILVDTNLLVYAHVGNVAQHERAKQWLDDTLLSGARVGLPWHSLLGFVRVVSNPRGFSRPEPIADAWRQVLRWLEEENTWVPSPTERHSSILDTLFSAVRVTSRFVMDAHLAALAIEHGLTLYSNDRDFARVPQLRWVNPLDA